MRYNWDDQVIANLAQYIAARRAVQRRRSLKIFFFHLGFYILGNIFLGVWNVLAYVALDDETLWFFLPLVFWGLALIIQYVVTVALFDDWWRQTERVIAERLTKG